MKLSFLPRSRLCWALLLATLLLAAASEPAVADTVTPSAVVATSSWYGPVSPDNLINGSGLSGVGDVLRQTHDNNSAAQTMWHAGPNPAGLPPATGNPPVVDDQALVFTLPRLYDLSAAYIWNHSQANLTSRGVDELEILVSAGIDPLTAEFTPINVFHLAEAAGNGQDREQYVNFNDDFPGVNLVKFNINSAHSGATNDLVGLAEVRFRGTSSALTRQQFINWGVEANNQIVADLQRPGEALFAETAHLDGTTSGGANGRAFAWPLSAQFRVYNSLAAYDPAYEPALRAFSDQLVAHYWSPVGSSPRGTPQGGYYCCSGGGERYYDDNAHIAYALAEAYQITGDQVYLDRAKATYNFLLSGEAPGEGGGSYWSEYDHSFLDSATALQGAKAALLIYQATGDVQYLQDAERTYGWARDTTQLPNGTFLEKEFLTGPKAGTVGDYALVNFAGFGLAANVLFYESTGDADYLAEAQQIAATSVNNYFNASTGQINDEGYWAYELVDGLVDLYEVDGNRQWYDAAVDAMEWLHDNKRDPNGHYGRFWGREGPQVGALEAWDLNDQAPVARAYLKIGLADVPGDEDKDGVVDGSDFLASQRQANPRVALPVWSDYYGATKGEVIGSAAATSAAVPEPASAAMLLLGVALCWGRRRGLRRLE